ncbi:methyltransferase domain-containing protein [Chaetomidium leptoderma]|uniref:Methyltransferase domain-containing protein n=1 Tax=Chaetomidium leptoderma TaxID=669021 RepID=A0AAN6ZVU2_9PEZI|nr:methyltransferase domain-containing protein [Chaetomidium leptoderma]
MACTSAHPPRGARPSRKSLYASRTDAAPHPRSSFTASLSSSAVDYPVEYGRRYHAFRSGVYPFPNDELELERLDLTHEMMVKGTGGKLYYAPLEKNKVKRILDIGTGTGIWAMVIADVFPDAEVVGNDLSAVQPRWIPPSVKFEIDDVESPWVYSTPFDFIFCRNLRPGGWAEFQDFDLQYYSDDGSLKDTQDGRRGQPRPQARGLGARRRLPERPRATLPIPQRSLAPAPAPQGDRAAQYNLAQVENGLEAFTLRLFTGVLGWQPEAGAYAAGQG